MHIGRRLAGAIAGFGVAAALLAGPVGGPPRAAALGPLPDCRIDDIRTVPSGYDDWSVTLVDWILMVGPDYKPPDLVSVRDAGIAGGGSIREIVIDDLRAMGKAAKANGTPLVAWSPYRGYRQQEKLFNGYAGWNGTRYTNYDSAINFSARPGHSEHQLGLTIDFVAVGDTGLTSNWEVTPTGKWMAQHAWEYGWLMSYPKGRQDVVCYSYEPWHYRYVGRELAKLIHDSGLTIREYLWANVTQVDPVTGSPLPTAMPTPEPTATPASTPTAPPTAAPTAAPLPTPGPTDPPDTGGTLFGLDAPVAIGLVLLLVVVGGVVAGRVLGRRMGVGPPA